MWYLYRVYTYWKATHTFFSHDISWICMYKSYIDIGKHRTCNTGVSPSRIPILRANWTASKPICTFASPNLTEDETQIKAYHIYLKKQNYQFRESSAEKKLYLIYPHLYGIVDSANFYNLMVPIPSAVFRSICCARKSGRELFTLWKPGIPRSNTAWKRQKGDLYVK